MRSLAKDKACCHRVAGCATEAVTIDGGTLLIDATKNVMAENTRVFKADVITDNGFIHVIDAVIVPK